MSDVFINAFWHIIERTIEGTCTVMLHMLKYIPGVQEVHDEAVGIGDTHWCMLLTALILKGWALKQLRKTHGNRGMSLNALRPKKCATRQCA